MAKKKQHGNAKSGSASVEQSPVGTAKKNLQVTPSDAKDTASPVVKTKKNSPSKQQNGDEQHLDMKETSEKIDHALQRRKSIEEVHDAGIIKTQEDMEKMAQVSEQVEEKLEARPNQEEMHEHNEHILNPTGASHRLSGALASTAKELEKSITSDKIDRHLVSRPDVEDLEKKHMINTNVAPQLQSVQKKLQRKMSADELAHRLDSRPDVQELRDQGIVHDDGVAPSLQATQEKLQRQLNADRVSHQLTKRPSITELTSQGVLDQTDTHVAPSLTATAKKLERNLVQNQVSHLLETRPEKDELVTHHILDADHEGGVAPILQGPKHQLERQLKADQVARHLRKRPSIGELEEKGIIEEGEIGDENTPVNKKFTLSRRARYALALKAASRIAADNLITQDEKARLKDRILSDDEKVVAAIECYELDQDIEEMLDTLYRVAKMT
uniref:RPEL repeat protein n=1 Tax=Globisporangium ultimum (strain ATCC 200006 / CBS 805.95 / DAOM BR144) TaxID=431595 RepID=K3WB35_GLOUD